MATEKILAKLDDVSDALLTAAMGFIDDAKGLIARD